MSTQTIIIRYTSEASLSLVDASANQPIYHVKVNRQAPQMEMIRLANPNEEPYSSFPEDEAAFFESRVCAAHFKITSLDVKLCIREQRDIELKRKGLLSTSYLFTSPSLSSRERSPTVLVWETDSANNAVGNFKLSVQDRSDVLVRFRNEAFSNERVGTF